MDVLTYEQIKELWEHQAIKRGGWKFAMGIFTHLWLVLCCALALNWFVATTQPEQVTTVSWAHYIGGGIFMIAIMLMNGALFRLQRVWLTQFWRRNVRSYVARFYRNSNGEQMLQYVIATPQENQDLADSMIGSDVGIGAFAIGLPLNGRPAQLMSTSRATLRRLAGWSVRLCRIMNGGVVEIEIRKRDRSQRTNARIVTDIGHALRYLEEIATTTGSASSSVSGFVHWMSIKLDNATRERKEIEQRMTTLHQIIAAAYQYDPSMPVRPVADVVEDNLRHLIAERQAARGEVDRYKDGFLPAAIADRDAARKEHTEAVVFVNDLAREIETTDRLHTLSGLRLLDRMLNWLCWWAAVQDSPEHPALQDRLAVVRAKLGEKERRERVRHGRTKPAAPAAT